MPENLVSRDGSAVPSRVSLLISILRLNLVLYLRDFSRVPRRRPFMKPPYAIGSVPSLSGHAIAYRWRSLPRVHRHRASKPQGSSARVLPWQVTMDQLIFASLSHTHYWYEVDMLKVPKQTRTCISTNRGSVGHNPESLTSPGFVLYHPRKSVFITIFEKREREKKGVPERGNTKQPFDETILKK